MVVYRVRVGNGHTLYGTIAVDADDSVTYHGTTPEYEQRLHLIVSRRHSDQRDWPDAQVVRVLPQELDSYLWAEEVPAEEGEA